MSRYNDELKLKLALQTAYELRTCPDADILSAESIDENLQKHLSFCDICRESRAMQLEEKNAWHSLHSKLSEITMRPASGTAKQCGQVWTLQKSLGAWMKNGRYCQPPAVLLLEQSVNSAAWKVAQLYEDKRLMGSGDVPLDDCFGFAEGWNCYEMRGNRFDKFMGIVKPDDLRQVIAASVTAFEPVPEDSILSFFRQMEIEVGKNAALGAEEIVQEELADVTATQPIPKTGFFEWLADLFTPARIAALAVMIFAVISIALLNTTQDKGIQTAQAPIPDTAAPKEKADSVKQPETEQANSNKKSATTITLIACADIVMQSKDITALEPIEITRGGLDNIDAGKAAFQVGITFINLIAAEKIGDVAARNEAKGQLEHLLSIVSGDQSFTVPPDLHDNRVLATFTEKIERATTKDRQLVMLRFGSWLQAARIADDEHLRQAVTPAIVEHFKLELAKLNTETSTMPILSNLTNSLRDKNTNVVELRGHLEKLYDAY